MLTCLRFRISRSCSRYIQARAVRLVIPSAIRASRSSRAAAVRWRESLEQRPAHALECRIALLLGAPGEVQRMGRVRDDVELVEGDLGVGKIVGGSLDEGRRHVE